MSTSIYASPTLNSSTCVEKVASSLRGWGSVEVGVDSESAESGQPQTAPELKLLKSIGVNRVNRCEYVHLFRAEVAQKALVVLP